MSTLVKSTCEPTPVVTIVSVAPKMTHPREAGFSRSQPPMAADTAAHAAFAETHVRRLEAMRCAGAGIEREQDGTWIIEPDHLERAAAYERVQAANEAGY